MTELPPDQILYSRSKQTDLSVRIEDGRDIVIVARHSNSEDPRGHTVVICPTLQEAKALGKWLCEAADHLHYDLTAMEPRRNPIQRLFAKLTS